MKTSVFKAFVPMGEQIVYCHMERPTIEEAKNAVTELFFDQEVNIIAFVKSYGEN